MTGVHDDYLEVNRAMWDERAPAHAASPRTTRTLVVNRVAMAVLLRAYVTGGRFQSNVPAWRWTVTPKPRLNL